MKESKRCSDESWKQICSFEDTISDLETRLKEAKEVIEFYGDKENYYAHYPDGDFDIDLDKGKKAREYIERYK